MDKFDRVFDRDYVAPLVRIAVVDERRERGRFAAAGRTHDEDKAALGHADILHYGRQPPIIDRFDDKLDLADNDPDKTFLPEDIYPEPAVLGLENGEVHLHFFFEFLLLLVIHHGICEVLRIFRSKGLVAVWRHDTFNTKCGRHAHGKINIRSVRFDHVLQVFIDNIHGSPHCTEIE